MHAAVRANSGQKIERDQKTQLLLFKSSEQNTGSAAKAGYCACPLHTPPPKGWAKPLSHPPARPLDTPLPSPHIRNKLAPPRGASKQENLLFDLAPRCCSRGPNKALPEFLVWPLINFYCLRRQRTLVSNTPNHKTQC